MFDARPGSGLAGWDDATLLRRVLDAAPQAIVLFEMPSRRVAHLNPMAETYFGLPADVLRGQSPHDWPQWLSGLSASDIEALCASIDLAGEFPTGLHREVERPAMDGPTRIWDVQFLPIQSHPADDGPVNAVLLVAHDVTEFRTAEQERFDAAIAQRGMLVQEVHHRIKNNLQGVAGLLQQTAERFPEVGSILSEAVGQLQAIAQVYGLQVGSSGPVPLVGLVQAVAQAVHRTFAREVDLVVRGEEVERWRLPEAESIPVALTTNELLTNAVKHGQASAAIELTIDAQPQEVRIEIRNLGQLRAGFDPSAVAPGASGLGLVKALLPRRAATLSLAQEGERVLTRVVLRPPAVRRDVS
jgi:two-component sensor histidine kinase